MISQREIREAMPAKKDERCLRKKLTLRGLQDISLETKRNQAVSLVLTFEVCAPQ